LGLAKKNCNGRFKTKGDKRGRRGLAARAAGAPALLMSTNLSITFDAWKEHRTPAAVSAKTRMVAEGPQTRLGPAAQTHQSIFENLDHWGLLWMPLPTVTHWTSTNTASRKAEASDRLGGIKSRDDFCDEILCLGCVELEFTCLEFDLIF